ncbi:hypothetical protein K493DRAFT_307898 [Basidiobolus meristosporus CBS 931.73]|uniref:Uncharacterized protein n=1 Tax=Basidiobolus meristosporus CBS 931.73 TaxID=1314790 RepID=A0A1Y1X9V6_9FUNG|nr:hypothetical protein K493DRAFT_307898 [Basidiobolus meristosporus CBS 931.73]|eukprot:ORX82124.1 hypothetical protein K493DRAFT_307898 [Basidiobolus meristosporus CBS 931.73]
MSYFLNLENRINSRKQSGLEPILPIAYTALWLEAGPDANSSIIPSLARDDPLSPFCCAKWHQAHKNRVFAASVYLLCILGLTDPHGVRELNSPPINGAGKLVVVIQQFAEVLSRFE